MDVSSSDKKILKILKLLTEQKVALIDIEEIKVFAVSV